MRSLIIQYRSLLLSLSYLFLHVFLSVWKQHYVKSRTSNVDVNDKWMPLCQSAFVSLIQSMASMNSVGDTMNYFIPVWTSKSSESLFLWITVESFIYVFDNTDNFLWESIFHRVFLFMVSNAFSKSTVSYKALQWQQWLNKGDGLEIKTDLPRVLRKVLIT